MKNKLKGDNEIVAREGDITINIKELKTSLPKLVDENRSHLTSYDLLKKLMLLIEVRLEIIQHTLKSALIDNTQIISDTKKIIVNSSKTLSDITSYLNEEDNLLKELKKNE